MALIRGESWSSRNSESPIESVLFSEGMAKAECLAKITAGKTKRVQPAGRTLIDRQ
jgi:hypothetical protein